MVLLSSVMDIVGLSVPIKQIMDYALLMPDIQLGVAPLQTPSCLSRNTMTPDDTLSLFSSHSIHCKYRVLINP
jgi:hypothetical protein